MSRNLVLLALTFITIATEAVALRASSPNLSPGNAPSSISSPSKDPFESLKSPSKSPSLRSILIPPESSSGEENGSPSFSLEVSSILPSSPQGYADGFESSPNRSPASSPNSVRETKTIDKMKASVFAPNDGTNEDYADYT